MTKKNLIKVSANLWFTGEKYNFNDIAQIIGFPLDLMREKESIWKPGSMKKFCEYSTDYQDSLDIEDQLLQIQVLIQGKTNQIRLYCEENDVELGVCIVIYTRNSQFPGIAIPKEFVALAAQMNARFDFDIYCNSITINNISTTPRDSIHWTSIVATKTEP